MNATYLTRRTPLTRVSAVSSRTLAQTPRLMYATRTHIGPDKPGSQSTKLSFRFGPKNVPIELWPMGFVIVAGLTGGSFALYHHLTVDDLRHHNSGKLESTPHLKGSGSGASAGLSEDGARAGVMSATEYSGDGKPVPDS